MTVPERFRGLFRKYFLVLFVAAVLPLALDGAIEAWFGYRDQRLRLNDLLSVQANAAAAETNGFIENISGGLGWLVQLPWTEQTDDRRRIDAFRLLRQTQAITSVALIDDQQRERLYVSRIGLNRIDSRIDRSADPAAVGLRSARMWFGDITYNRGSEPRILIAMAGNRPSVGAVIAEVNLKLIWDVVSAIKIGEKGFAFVLDRPGRLIAHPDISLVLRGADESTSRPFQAIRNAIGRVRSGVAIGGDADRQVVAAAATIAGPDWTVVVAQPTSEAFAPTYAALWRTAIFLLVGAVCSGVLAYALARRMTEPIHLLEEGTRQIGAGVLDHRVDIRTGDELERLADGFNKMAAGLLIAQEHHDRIERLKRFLAPQVAELVDQPGNDSLLEGRRTEVVVLFCDLRGFTAFSSEAPPEDVMTLLSEYYQTLGREISSHSATLVNFSGDGLMVLLNAPVPVENPGLIALDLAIAMQAGVQALIKSWRQRGYHIGFGIGLAGGYATVGRIGYDNRFDYTAIGSVVNLAAHLCATAGDREILIDAALAETVGHLRSLERLGLRSIKGYGEALAVFRLSFDG